MAVGLHELARWGAAVLRPYGGRRTQDPGAKAVPGAPETQEKKTAEGFLASQTPLGMTGSGQGGAPTTQEKRNPQPKIRKPKQEVKE